MYNINKIIDIIRNLKEEGPTMSLGAGQIAGTKEAGDDPPVFSKGRNRKNYAKGGKGSRKLWLQFLNRK